MGGSDVDGRVEGQRRELRGRRRLVDAVHLVHHQHHASVAAPQPLGDFLIGRGETGSGVHQQHHGVGLIHGQLGLAFHGGGELRPPPPAGRRCR